ncbi:MerR family transcriptional regulator [Clostridiaceae bacterium M8S5]|nr:MerR family transcriptional regulator [Clostridiaceae bacterium M8S5]
MDIRNCKKCGRIYNFDGFKLCLSCRQEEEEVFKVVRDYIYENPTASIQKISEDTEVPVKKILGYLKEGRLEIRNADNNLLLNCERCGKPISTGRYCDRCAVEMSNVFQQAIRGSNPKKVEKKDTKSDRMFISNRFKK